MCLGVPGQLSNHGKPPAAHLAELFMAGTHKRRYSKIRDGAAILRDQDLEVAAARCPELRALRHEDQRLACIVPLATDLKPSQRYLGH